MLWKLNRVSWPQREWNIEIVSFDCGQEMSYVWIEAIITMFGLLDKDMFPIKDLISLMKLLFSTDFLY